MCTEKSEAEASSPLTRPPRLIALAHGRTRVNQPRAALREATPCVPAIVSKPRERIGPSLPMCPKRDRIVVRVLRCGAGLGLKGIKPLGPENFPHLDRLDVRELFVADSELSFGRCTVEGELEDAQVSAVRAVSEAKARCFDARLGRARGEHIGQ